MKKVDQKVDLEVPDKTRRSSSLRLVTLIKLRWAAILGQLTAVLAVYFVFGFDLKVVWCVGVIILSVWLNIFLSIKFKANVRIGDKPAACLLAYDILQLSGLLFLTGGLQNPFALFLLVPTTIAAGSLLLPYVLALSGLTVVCASFLVFHHLPLPWYPGDTLELDNLYIYGVWGALLIGMAFFGLFAWRVADERRAMDQALIASDMVLAREQKLSALDGMAAAMAHELGTPLSTINVAAKDMMKDIKKYPEISEDIALIYSQALKCRDVLSAMGKETAGDRVFAKMNFETLISEVVETHHNQKIKIISKCGPETRAGEKISNAPVIERNPAIIYGLGNIVSNAVRHARKKVLIEVTWSHAGVKIIVEDDGPGFDGEIIDYLGDPILPKLRAKATSQGGAKITEGMGLGLFIAKTFLERSEAKLSFSTTSPSGKGARVEITWGKSVFST